MAFAPCLLIGFALSGIAGIFVGGELGLTMGLLVAWLGGNVLSLALAYASYRIERARPKAASARLVRELRPAEGAETREAAQAA